MGVLIFPGKFVFTPRRIPYDV